MQPAQVAQPSDRSLCGVLGIQGDRRGPDREGLGAQRTSQEQEDEAMPMPLASGSAPNIAAIVVIMIGWNLTRHAW